MRIVFHGCTVVALAIVSANAVAQPPANPKPGAKPPEAAKPVAALSGAWVVTSATQDGKALADMECARMIIAAKDVIIQGKDGMNLSFPFTVDPTQKPRAIDFPLVGGEGWLKLNGHFKGIYELDRDSLRLCIGSDDKRPTKFSDQGATLIVLKRQKFMPVATFTGHATEVLALAFNADGKQVVSVSAKDVRFWHADSGKEIASQAISWSGRGDKPVFAIGPDGPDGPTVALFEWRQRAGEKGVVAQIVLFSAKSGKNLLEFDPRGDADKKLPLGVTVLAFSPDGKHLTMAGSVSMRGDREQNGVVRIIDAKTGKDQRQLGELRKMDLNSATGNRPPTGELVPGVSTSTGVSSATYSADGKYIVAGTYGEGSELPEAGEVLIWNAADGNLVRMFTVADKVEARGPDYRVSAVALSPDNKRVAATVAIVPAGGPRRDEHPTEVRIWGIATGDLVHTLHGHKGWVGQLAFSPDGKWLASAGRDKVVRLWSTRTGKEVIALPFDTPQINAVAFCPDGNLLAAGGGDGKKSGEVRMWACPKD